MPDARTLTWPEVQRLAQSGAWALLPVGSTEAHGPHLPLSVDVLIAEAVCARLAERLASRHESSVQFPPITYALTEFAAPFPGTVSLPADVAQSLLESVLESLVRQGFTHVAVINHHLEPAHFALVHSAARTVASRTGGRIVVPDHRRRPHSEELGEEFVRGGSHAGCYETSLLLAVAPSLVREPIRTALPELAVNLPAVIKAGAKDFLACGGPDAYFGNPAHATAEEGERLLGLLVDLCDTALRA